MFCEMRTGIGLNMGGLTKLAAFAVFAAGTAWFATPVSAQQTGQATYPTAIAASKALVAALQSGDPTAITTTLGPDAKDILMSGDDVADKNARMQFVQRYLQMHRMVMEPDGTTTLYIGAENWPAPIPLVHKADAWYFDTPAGKKEILYRRIGKNEMAVMRTCHELVDAEKEYYAAPHDGDSVKQYAQHIFSDPGKQNGLYWQTASGAPESPIGPLVAMATSEGYVHDPNLPQQPFEGYYFRILSAQGAKVHGGAKSYIVDGKMTRGFAVLAYPADYRSSGVMTFIVDQDGTLYQKDLGPKTEDIAKSLQAYNKDLTWRKAE